MTSTATESKTSSTPVGFEELLLKEGLVTEAQLDRARRVASQMHNPKPLGEVLVELGQLARTEYDRVVRVYRSNLSIARVLEDEGRLEEKKMAAYATARSENPRKSDRQLLVESGLVTEEEFVRALADKQNIPYVEPEVALIDTELLSKTSFRYLVSNNVLPIRIIDGELNAILAEPEKGEQILDLERIYGVPVRPCCATSARITEALQTLERVGHQSGRDETTALQYRELPDISEEEDIGEEAFRIVDYLLTRAIEQGASDLHIEPMQNKVKVRTRVDGVLRDLTVLPFDFAPRVVSRIKVLAGADIAERRHHQDGRIFVRVESREVDIRVSTYASMFGETVVMRLLDRDRGLLPLESIGFEPMVLGLLRDVVLRASSGMVLVTGPTGSGKTTTLYSFVDFVNSEEIKVITCEDPVEYVLQGVTQCSVNEKTGPTFADSLRAIVRQDPDIVIVGEVRDGRTADMAVQSALTGHKVLSTFHTEDAVGAVTRLLDMGLEPFLVSSTLTCIVAQRLVRKLCKNCRLEVAPSRRDVRFLGATKEDLLGGQFFEGVGCIHCGGAGYKGRLGIHEVLLPNDDFRDAIMRREPSKELRALARRLPAFTTLQESGLLKAAAGVTTLAEVVANAPRDPAARPLPKLQKMLSRRIL